MKKEHSPIYEPWSTLNWSVALLAFPVGLLFALSLKIYSFFIRIVPVDFDKLPKNALIYGTHYDVYFSCFNHNLRIPPTIVIGYHGFLPYLYIPWDRFTGISHLCFRKNSSEPALDQIVSLLDKFSEHRLLIFTDSGGPYERVRKSLATLAIRSNRPLVAVRQKATKYFSLMGHRIPLPFSTIDTKFSESITPEWLSKVSLEEARDRLQSYLEGLN